MGGLRIRNDHELISAQPQLCVLTSGSHKHVSLLLPFDRLKSDVLAWLYSIVTGVTGFCGLAVLTLILLLLSFVLPAPRSSLAGFWYSVYTGCHDWHLPDRLERKEIIKERQRMATLNHLDCLLAHQPKGLTIHWIVWSCATLIRRLRL